MKSFYEFCNIIEAVDNNAILKQIEDAIDAAVEGWKKDTIDSMTAQTKNFKQPNLWQRFMGGVKNLWHGRDNEKNPMYNQNAYGHGWGQNQKEWAERLEGLFEEAQVEIDKFLMSLNEAAAPTPTPTGTPPTGTPPTGTPPTGTPPTGTPPTGTPPTGTPPTASSDPKIFNFIRAAADKLKVQLKDQVKKILASTAPVADPAATPPTGT